jgi:hypothetical protein
MDFDFEALLKEVQEDRPNQTIAPSCLLFVKSPEHRNFRLQIISG